MTLRDPYLGIIEGFFGSSWTWGERAGYAPFLSTHGYSFYVYAPKEDPFFRKRWRDPIPEDHFQSLKSLASTYKAHGLEFGVGFSPYEAYREYTAASRKVLQDKIRTLNTLSPDLLCVLFDDMKGDVPHLAETQIRILGDIRDVSEAPRIIFCPTYYSYDPIIQRCFGPMPDRYLEDLGAGLDTSIDLFWTGEKVMSSEYSESHLVEVAERLQRKPFLWDNYPVNDSKKASPFLFVRGFENRGPHLRGLLSGHAVNPMKQPWLSRIPVATLPLNYSQSPGYDRDSATLECSVQVCGDHVGRMLWEDVALLHEVGLSGLTEEQKGYLKGRYSQYPEDPFCQEVVRWLGGEYEFDPACLTE
jgi:hypothetical protein